MKYQCFFCRREINTFYFIVVPDKSERDRTELVCNACAHKWLVKEDDTHWSLRIPLHHKTPEMKKVIDEMERQMREEVL